MDACWSKRLLSDPVPYWTLRHLDAWKPINRRFLGSAEASIDLLCGPYEMFGQVARQSWTAKHKHFEPGTQLDLGLEKKEKWRGKFYDPSFLFLSLSELPEGYGKQLLQIILR